METIYQQSMTLLSAGISDLLSLLQEAASCHQTALGMGQAAMRDRGLLWMITRQKLVWERPTVAGEAVTISTWLSEGRHGMYLRQYEVTGGDGVLCRAAAIWTLVDEKKRTLAVLPLDVPFYQGENQIARFPLLRRMEPVQAYPFTVPAAYLDENGHMNNARYFDAVAPILPADGFLRTAQVDYHAEAREGETLTIGFVKREKEILVQTQGDRGLCFRMKLEYE